MRKSFREFLNFKNKSLGYDSMDNDYMPPHDIRFKPGVKVMVKRGAGMGMTGVIEKVVGDTAIVMDNEGRPMKLPLNVLSPEE